MTTGEGEQAPEAQRRPEAKGKGTSDTPLGARFQRVSLASPTAKRTVTLAISDLATGERLVTWALRHLLRPGDRVLLLHVRPYLYPPDTYLTPALIDIGGVWDFDDSYEITNRRIAHKTLAFLKRNLAEAGVECVPLALRGEARQVLEEKARELGTDVMVVGTRELGGFTRMWEGSVGDHLLHHLDCPLVVVR
jgi:nucleotide-binding universal stress UspA family protein